MELNNIISSLEDVNLSNVVENFNLDLVTSMASNPVLMGLLVLAAQILSFFLQPASVRNKVSADAGYHFVPPWTPMESNDNCGVTTGGEVQTAFFSPSLGDIMDFFHFV